METCSRSHPPTCPRGLWPGAILHACPVRAPHLPALALSWAALPEPEQPAHTPPWTPRSFHCCRPLPDIPRPCGSWTAMSHLVRGACLLDIRRTPREGRSCVLPLPWTRAASRCCECHAGHPAASELPPARRVPPFRRRVSPLLDGEAGFAHQHLCQGLRGGTDGQQDLDSLGPAPTPNSGQSKSCVSVFEEPEEKSPLPCASVRPCVFVSVYRCVYRGMSEYVRVCVCGQLREPTSAAHALVNPGHT